MKKSYLSLRTACLVAFLSLGSIGGHAQVTLNAGSILPISWNSLNPTNTLRFAVLQDISAGSVIYFTDWGWDNGTGAFNVTSAGSPPEGRVIWTVGSTVVAGSVLELRTASGATLTNVSTSASLNANIVVVNWSVTDPIPATGDGFFVHQLNGSSDEFFISGFNNSAGGTSVVDANGWNTSIVLTAVDTQLPNGNGSSNSLTNGVNAIGMTTASGLRNLDNVAYVGPTSVTDTATWRARFANIANWSGDNTGVVATSIGTTFPIGVATPVSLVTFNAVRGNGVVNLFWKTASERNANSFVVERSADGRQFATAGTVAAKGEAASYQFRDVQAPVSGTLYYRLRMKDKDGSETLSSLVVVNDTKAAAFSVSVRPNPLRGDKMGVAVELQEDAVVHLQLTDLTGKVLKAGSRQAQAGRSTIELDGLETLPAGFYLLKVSAAGREQVVKVMK